VVGLLIRLLCAVSGQEGPAASNEYIQAMDALLYDDDDTPDALAVAAKEKGNAAYVKGKAYHGNALRYYKEALDHCKKCKVKKSKMRQLESQVRSNMAAILLERNRSWDVLCECEKAIDLWSGNVKAYMRAGKACMSLGRLQDAVKFCTAGLTFEGVDAKVTPALVTQWYRIRVIVLASVACLRSIIVSQGPSSRLWLLCTIAEIFVESTRWLPLLTRQVRTF
jgi:tetratricopeptide (TPR) repeat protein